MLHETILTVIGNTPCVRLRKLAPEQVIVIYDEIDLRPGKIRVKRGGGAGGHNGIRSIVEHLGPAFWRLRLGVGHPGPGRRDEVIGHVLDRPSAEDQDAIIETISDAAELLPVLIEQGAARAMNLLHSRKPAKE